MDEAVARKAFEQALEQYRPEFGQFFLARLFGLDISYEQDSCIVCFEVNDFMFNPQGSLHGGVIAFALDVSMGHLINHQTGAPGITLEMKTQYLRPTLSGRNRCRGSFLKRGRRISYMEARMWGGDGKLAATATATWQMPASPSE